MLLFTSRFDRNVESFSYLSFDSIFFADFLKKKLHNLHKRFNLGLDLCCGVGVQSFAIAEFCNQVKGVDINRSAVEYARLNGCLQEIENCTFHVGDILDDSLGCYDLIVANPPFINFERCNGKILDSDGGGVFGLEMTIKILLKLPNLLKDGGRAFILTRSPVVDGEDYLFCHLKGWLGGCLGCFYHHVADSVVSLSFFETQQGITGYRNVVLEITTEERIETIESSFWARQASLF